MPRRCPRHGANDGSPCSSIQSGRYRPICLRMGGRFLASIRTSVAIRERSFSCPIPHDHRARPTCKRRKTRPADPGKSSQAGRAWALARLASTQPQLFCIGRRWSARGSFDELRGKDSFSRRARSLVDSTKEHASCARAEFPLRLTDSRQANAWQRRYEMVVDAHN